LDRIDIHIEVPRIEYQKLSEKRLGEKSSTIQERVEIARQKQLERFSRDGIYCNADMRPEQIRKNCILNEPSEKIIRAAMTQMLLSGRAYHRVLKLARTIADLAGSEQILPMHLAESLQYRPRLPEIV
jgi:magnesium chelatase family protein